MVHVLEGTSVSLALQAADRIQAALDLPTRAFTYLRSHGELDKEHINDLADILARLTDADDRESVVRCAKGIYWLYGHVFRSLDAVVDAASPSEQQRRSA
jgi:pyrroloquinoline quinone (PQQ) biosynthesis protein C